MKRDARSPAPMRPVAATAFFYEKNGAGQAMLLTVLALGGAILGATSIAGLLMLYQIQGMTESEHSAKAIFAADSGVEWALFAFYCGLVAPSPRCDPQPEPPPPLPGDPDPGRLANCLGPDTNCPTVSVTCYNDSGMATTTCNNTTTAASAISRGTSFVAKRAFYVNLTTSSFP